MKKYAYSPDTGEIIRTETTAAWMGLTDVAPPEFDQATAGCFWRDDHWEIVQSLPPAKSDPASAVDPVAKLKAFLAENPDVAELLK